MSHENNTYLSSVVDTRLKNLKLTQRISKLLLRLIKSSTKIDKSLKPNLIAELINLDLIIFYKRDRICRLEKILQSELLKSENVEIKVEILINELLFVKQNNIDLESQLFYGPSDIKKIRKQIETSIKGYEVRIKQLEFIIGEHFYDNFLNCISCDHLILPDDKDAVNFDDEAFEYDSFAFCCYDCREEYKEEAFSIVLDRLKQEIQNQKLTDQYCKLIKRRYKEEIENNLIDLEEIFDCCDWDYSSLESLTYLNLKITSDLIFEPPFDERIEDFYVNVKCDCGTEFKMEFLDFLKLEKSHCINKYCKWVKFDDDWQSLRPHINKFSTGDLSVLG